MTAPASMTVRFTDWQCGHHCQRPDDIPVATEEQALLTLRAISHAIAQPGSAHGVIFTDDKGVDFYVTDDYISVGPQDNCIGPIPEYVWNMRPIVVYGDADTIEQIHSYALEEARETLDAYWHGTFTRWNDSILYGDEIVTTTLSLAELEAMIVYDDYPDEGKRKVFALPPVFRAAADVLAELQAEATLNAAEEPALLDTSGGWETRENLVRELAGIGHACAGVELHPLGFAPFGEIVRVNVHADNPDAFGLEAFAAGIGCGKPLIVGPMEFVTIFEHGAQPVEVLSLEPRHPGGLDLGIHADYSDVAKSAIYPNKCAEVQP